MNPEPEDSVTGTIGELFVQIKMLQEDVKILIPLIDTGNDFIAIKEQEPRSVQVKTRNSDKWDLSDLKKYDILALVRLGPNAKIDGAKVFLLSKKDVADRMSLSISSLNGFEFSTKRLNNFFR